MKIVIQRVKQASVIVEEKIVGEIKEGILVFIGIMQGDTPENADYLAKKTAEFRIFRDENGRMNRSLLDIKGEILVVSQFTLAADGKKGKRPSFDKAASPDFATTLYERYIQNLKMLGITAQMGIFGAYMQVNIVNDGPATFIIEKD